MNRKVRRHAPMPAEVDTTTISGKWFRKNSAATRSDSMSLSVARDDTPSCATKAPDGANAAKIVESPILAAPLLRSHRASLFGRGTQIPTALHPSSRCGADSARPLLPPSTTAKGWTSAMRLRAFAANEATAFWPRRLSSSLISSTNRGASNFSMACVTTSLRSASHCWATSSVGVASSLTGSGSCSPVKSSSAKSSSSSSGSSSTTSSSTGGSPPKTSSSLSSCTLGFSGAAAGAATPKRSSSSSDNPSSSITLRFFGSLGTISGAGFSGTDPFLMGGPGAKSSSESSSSAAFGASAAFGGGTEPFLIGGPGAKSSSLSSASSSLWAVGSAAASAAMAGTGVSIVWLCGS
mmetsp:Transcript_14471/g.41225  ORF Transcript_14471/g.41225 Transcript_14471/m.41225 type:complete len:351 (-) Transcript_14471:98-1150(-)